MIELVGCIHIHSIESGGIHTIPELVMIAKQAGVDFLVMAENWKVEKILPFCGYRNNVLIIPGAENEVNGIHFLSLGQKGFACKKGWSLSFCIAKTEKAGAKNFIAHPEKLNLFGRKLKMLSSAWQNRRVYGFELWSMMERWLHKISWVKDLFGIKIILPAPSTELLKKWDFLSMSGRKLSAIGSVDRYNLNFFNHSINIFQARNPFNRIRTHVFVPETNGDAETDSNAIIDALCRGHAFIANDEITNSKNTRFLFKKKESIKSACGMIVDSIELNERISLIIELPKKGRIILVRNGEIIDSLEGLSKEWEINKKGIYRIEARQNSKPWIFTNPIFIGYSPYYPIP